MHRSICTRLKSCTFASALLLLLVTTTSIEARTIRVPFESATIQGAINAAMSGDIVEVAPGTYFEKIDFLGKAITVRSEQGPLNTFIDGNHKSGPLVTFDRTETHASVLSGFTIQNGRAPFGAGIFIRFSSPKIQNNIIRANEADAGAGILMTSSGAMIEDNEIVDNRIVGFTTPGGGGIRVHDSSGALIARNKILRNSVIPGNGGGGLHITGVSNFSLRDNIISENTASFGGGIFLNALTADASIVQNLIVRNSAEVGAGIAWNLSGTQLINNTIADNDGFRGSGVFVVFVPVSGNPLIANNNIIGKGDQVAIDCMGTPPAISLLRFNNVFSPSGLSYGFNCGVQLPVKGSISADPRFVDPIGGDFRLRPDSPSIDLGGNDIPHLPDTDFNGALRILDGNGDGIATIDIGAFEFNHLPFANAGPDQTVACGANCLAVVLLDGSSSSDPDGDPLTFTWTGSFGTASGATPSVSLPKGQHAISLTVSDPFGNTSSDTVIITIVDTTPPVLASVNPTPNTLLQANHQMVPVTVAVSATDNCDPSVVCRIVSVASNEPEEGLGDGDTAPDWVITGSLNLNLRAERSGKGIGRIYTITVECTDSSSNNAASTATVAVPRNN
jgi:hypothetical protein